MSNVILLIIFLSLTSFYLIYYQNPSLFYVSRYWLFASSLLFASFIGFRLLIKKNISSLFTTETKSIFLFIAAFSCMQFFVTDYSWCSFLREFDVQLEKSPSSITDFKETDITKLYCVDYWNIIELSYMTRALNTGRVDKVFVTRDSLFNYLKNYKTLNPPNLSRYNIITTISYKNWGHK